MEKVKQYQKVLAYVFILLITAFSFNACSKDNPDNIFAFYASLDGDHAIPTNSETATGYCNASYDSIANKLAYTITWNNLTGTPTTISFQAPDGSGGFIDIPVTNILSNGGVSGYLLIDQVYEHDLINENFYVNVTTAAHSTGEIRGRLIKPQ